MMMTKLGPCYLDDLDDHRLVSVHGTAWIRQAEAEPEMIMMTMGLKVVSLYVARRL